MNFLKTIILLFIITVGYSQPQIHLLKSDTSTLISTKNDLVWTKSNNTKIYFVDSVGIGTTTPTEKLDINGNLKARNYGLGSVSGATGWKYIPSFDANGKLTDDSVIGINNLGNVGIGTNSPIQKLDVNGNVQIFNNLYIVNPNNKIFVDQSAGTAFDFHLNNQNIVSLERISSAFGQFQIRQFNTGSTADNFPAYSFKDDTNTGMALFGADILALVTGGATKLIVTSAGNVGIGTTAPNSGSTLHVGGTSSMIVPVGTTAERPVAAQGMIRYNTTTSKFEGYTGSEWVDLH